MEFWGGAGCMDSLGVAFSGDWKKEREKVYGLLINVVSVAKSSCS